MKEGELTPLDMMRAVAGGYADMLNWFDENSGELRENDYPAIGEEYLASAIVCFIEDGYKEGDNDIGKVRGAIHNLLEVAQRALTVANDLAKLLEEVGK